MEAMTKPYFSIVIPTLNEEKFLPGLLDDLATQTFENFEVIHVDGKSIDSTVKLAKKYAKKLNLRQILGKAQNQSHQRNLGGKSAKGEWIIFMDADDRLPNDFLEMIHQKITTSENTCDVFSSLINLNEKDSKKIKHHIISRVINLRATLTSNTKNPAVLGAMFGVKKVWFKKIKFNEKLSFGEDIDCLSRLIAAGAEYKLFHQPRYYYSMRRWDKDSLIKSAIKSIKLEFKILSGKYDDADYEMSGGSKY